MLKERTDLRMHPLDVWQSEDVYTLLRDFFAANFAKASLPETIAHDFVDTAWQGKQSGDYEAVRQACNTIFIAHQKQAAKPNECDPLDMVDLSAIQSFADIGANKHSAINFYMRKYPHIKQFYAIDIVPQQSHFHDKTRGTYIQVSPTATEFPVMEKVDCVHFRFSLHHFESLAHIRRAFANAAAMVTHGGMLILWEESFTATAPDERAIVHMNHAHGIQTDSDLTRRFYALNERRRWEFIMANDWLVNVNNAHMPWTGQHYRFDEWSSLLVEHGFALDHCYNLGLRVSGRLKQGVHMCGIFTKKRP